MLTTEEKKLNLDYGIDSIAEIVATLLNEELISKNTFDRIKNMISQIKISIPSSDDYFIDFLKSFGPETVKQTWATSAAISTVRTKIFKHEGKNFILTLEEVNKPATNK